MEAALLDPPGRDDQPKLMVPTDGSWGGCVNATLVMPVGNAEEDAAARALGGCAPKPNNDGVVAGGATTGPFGGVGPLWNTDGAALRDVSGDLDGVIAPNTAALFWTRSPGGADDDGVTAWEPPAEGAGGNAPCRGVGP